jgi:hypothetical protein
MVDSRVMAITKWSISDLGAATQTACQQRGDDSSAKFTGIFASYANPQIE